MELASPFCHSDSCGGVNGIMLFHDLPTTGLLMDPRLPYGIFQPSFPFCTLSGKWRTGVQ